MDRRKFFRGAGLATAGAVITPSVLAANNSQRGSTATQSRNKTAKNIIFLVSDGMSTGTLNMADILSRRMYGRPSYWLNTYEKYPVNRALMDTASENSIVTDSAAASSAWGGGKRVKNGRLNIGSNGEKYTPILQKFKNSGKAVGCVTSVPITHATPAGFCVNNKSRGNQAEIAEDYLELKFDVMLGGGKEYFTAKERKDGKDLFQAFKDADFGVAQTKNDLEDLKDLDKPILGAFHESGIPYALDHKNLNDKKEVPSLEEMTRFAINKLSKNENGFVLQVEGGKVDWAAHGNDTGGLLFDQLAFDECIKIAMDFAENRDDTLVIITTDHGNANPGLFYGAKSNQNFDLLHDYKHTNRWVLRGIDKSTSKKEIVERVEYAQGYKLMLEEAEIIRNHYQNLPEPAGDNDYNDYSLPHKKLAEIQTQYTNIGWAGMHHSADYVELAMFGAGAEMLPTFIKNFELHHFMLKATEVEG